MLSKIKIQFLKSLHEKSGRKESGCFLVEGRKGIEECISSDFEIVEGFFLGDGEYRFPYEVISQKELEKISTLVTNTFGLIVVKMKKEHQIPYLSYPSRKEGIMTPSEGNLVLILDSINDPGNLGTIIRTADWYGVRNIICSMDTVDCYNPKVVLATMGSLTRVNIFYTDLEEYFSGQNSSFKQEVSTTSSHSSSSEYLPKVYGAYLDGESIREKRFTSKYAYLIIGSESHGISARLEKYITDKISIPRYGGAESLNAGVATGVLLDRILGG